MTSGDAAREFWVQGGHWQNPSHTQAPLRFPVTECLDFTPVSLVRQSLLRLCAVVFYGCGAWRDVGDIG